MFFRIIPIATRVGVSYQRMKEKNYFLKKKENPLMKEKPINYIQEKKK